MKRIVWCSKVYLILLTTLAVLFSCTPLFEYSWQPNIDLMFSSPSWSHWLGTDSLGRDMMAKIFSASAVSLLVGFAGGLLSLALGAGLGLWVGYRGGLKDLFVMRGVELFTSLPQMITAGLWIYFVSSYSTHLRHSPFLFVVALGLSTWPVFTLLTRQLVLREKEKPYIEAAKSLGASDLRILFRHVLPNIFPTLIISLGVHIPGFLMFESILSFIGLGIQPPYTSWGVLIQEGWKSLAILPHLAVGPAIFLFLTSLSVNLIFTQARSQVGKDLGGTQPPQ